MRVVKNRDKAFVLSALKNEPIVIEYVPGKFKTILWNSPYLINLNITL
jgi:hypothetical protein